MLQFISAECAVTQWIETPCSATCGKGVLHRKRQFLDLKAKELGCSRKLTQSVACDSHVPCALVNDCLNWINFLSLFLSYSLSHSFLPLISRKSGEWRNSFLVAASYTSLDQPLNGNCFGIRNHNKANTIHHDSRRRDDQQIKTGC